MSKIGIDRRIRANLIRLRLEAGLDQNSLARKSGVSNVAHIEAGIRPAGKQALVKLAWVLGVDVYEFFLPENIRAVRDNNERLFLDLITACTQDGQKFIMDTILYFLKYENKRKGPRNENHGSDADHFGTGNGKPR